MSTAQLVPETWELTGDDAAKTLRRARFRPLLADSLVRFSSADGMSLARSLAFALVLTVIPGVIAIVGFASLSGAGSLHDGIADLLTGISPGPTGDILTAAIGQGDDTSSSHGSFPLIVGLLAMFVSGATVFGEIERSGNRIYGVEGDRPLVAKYARAIAIFGGYFAVAVVLFVLFQTRPSFLRDLDLGGPGWLWTIGQIVIGFAIAVPCFAIVYKVSPRRHQPGVSWLVVGSGIATVLWLVSTLGLKLFWSQGNTFGETYGPLAGVIGLALWAYVIAVGLLLGLSFAAQLEAVRAGCGEPQDDGKVQDSEPGSGHARPGADSAATDPAREKVAS